MIIDIEETQLETRTKKDGGTYQVQKGYAHTVDQNGGPKRYPEQITIFPPRDGQGNPVAYKEGQYELSARSFKIERGFLELGFINLVPYKTK